MTMATVAYKRRLFPVQLLKARPMAASLGAPGLIIMRNRGGFDKNRGNPENFFFFCQIFFYPHIFFLKSISIWVLLNLKVSAFHHKNGGPPAEMRPTAKI